MYSKSATKMGQWANLAPVGNDDTWEKGDRTPPNGNTPTGGTECRCGSTAFLLRALSRDRQQAVGKIFPIM